LQIRLVDPATKGVSAGLGACTGDSGAPVFRSLAGRFTLVGVVTWATGPGNSAGCGGLTGVTPLTLYGEWITQTAKKLGNPF
jgi:secreted trypsin-like serine protease